MTQECLIEDSEFYVTIITNSISISSAIVVIILCLISRFIERLTSTIIIFLSINSIARSSLDIASFFASGVPCIIISYLKNIFLISSVIWSGFIAKTLDDVITCKKDYNPKLFKLSFLASYLLIPLLELLPFTTSSYESKNCIGLKVDRTGLIWRMTIAYLPCLIIIAFTIIYYYRMYKYIKSKDNVAIKGILIDRGLLFSLIFILIFIILAIIRIVEYFHQNYESSCFRLVGVIFIYLQGLFVLVITLARDDIQEMLCCKERKNQRLESDADYLNFLIN